MMEAVSISETFVNFYQTSRDSISEDSHPELISSYLAALGESVLTFWQIL
jgi:hypothetical protein